MLLKIDFLNRCDWDWKFFHVIRQFICVCQVFNLYSNLYLCYRVLFDIYREIHNHTLIYLLVLLLIVDVNCIPYAFVPLPGQSININTIQYNLWRGCAMDF